MKDWNGNSNSIFKTLGASNHTDKDRQEDDFYATDPIAIDKLLTKENLVAIIIFSIIFGIAINLSKKTCDGFYHNHFKTGY